MDHSPSIITQVTRDEEENATCREEGEFWRSFGNFSAAHDSVREAQVSGVFRLRRCPKCHLYVPWTNVYFRQTCMPLNDIVTNILTELYVRLKSVVFSVGHAAAWTAL